MKKLIFTLVTVLGLTAASAQTEQKTTTNTNTETGVVPTHAESHTAVTTTKSTTMRERPVVIHKVVRKVHRKRVVRRAAPATPTSHTTVETKVTLPTN